MTTELEDVELQISKIEDNDVRNAMYALINILKKHADDLSWIFTYAEGVR